ncbi:MAG: AMP-binding protein, partial [Thermodesulfobacteriota bacterium]|nr:AMP-binding protein [Thermodesulfobacteriota bacterium]
MYQERPWLESYEKDVPHSLTYPDTLIHKMLMESADRYSENTAVRLVLKYLPLGIAIQWKITYGELHEMTDRFAGALTDLGVKKGDRVGVILPNLPQTLISFFGVMKIGGVVVNINPIYTAREIQHQLSDSGAETVEMPLSIT